MIRNSLPAVLQQVLEYHVNESPLTHYGEIQGLYFWSQNRKTNVNNAYADTVVSRIFYVYDNMSARSK